MNLPLKTRILEYVIDAQKAVTVDDIFRDLASEYKGEGLFNKKRIQYYLDSFLGVKFMDPEKVEYDEEGNLVIHAVITDYGLSREKYLPGRG